MANFKKIRVLARQKEISLKKLSEELGITEQGLSKIIKNNSTSSDTIEKLCDYFKVPASFFFENIEKTHNYNIEKYVDILEENRQLRIKIEKIETELFEIKKENVEEVADAMVAITQTGTYG